MQSGCSTRSNSYRSRGVVRLNKYSYLFYYEIKRKFYNESLIYMSQISSSFSNFCTFFRRTRLPFISEFFLLDVKDLQYSLAASLYHLKQDIVPYGNNRYSAEISFSPKMDTVLTSK